MTDGREIENYLSELRRHLGPMTLDDREEIVREIQAHIRDAAEQNGASADDVLARLGPASELAAEYREGLLIRQASRSFSPLTLLRGALRAATKGVAGTMAFLAGLIGYTTGVGFVLGALLKPFFPDKVGVFVQQTHSASETVGATVASITANGPRHELLGLWAIPLFLVLGSLTLLATTVLIRSVLRESRQWQLRLQPH
ncbi:MAG TPA: hypothetical protein VE291_11195 [Terracidiphilus sp.]|jgi:uncharacterized membrane protein|nr:hypothetical protein [Terracidiphilus sp.]